MAESTQIARSALLPFFLKKRLLRAFAILFGLMPIMPVLALSIAFLLHMAANPEQALSAINDQQLEAAALNSGVISFFAAIIGGIISVALVLTLRSYRAVLVLVFCLLFVPGSLVALGFDVIAHQLGLGSVGTEFLLVASLVGYVLPFQALIFVTTIVGIRENEKFAVVELFSDPSEQVFYWLRRLQSTAVATLAIGYALAFTEYPRSQGLGRDLFNLGSTYFGPLFVSRYYTQGIPDLYVFASSILVGLALFLIGRRWMRGIAS